MRLSVNRYIITFLVLVSLFLGAVSVRSIHKKKELFQSYEITVGHYEGESWSPKLGDVYTYQVNGNTFKTNGKYPEIDEETKKPIVYFSPNNPSNATMRIPKNIEREDWYIAYAFFASSAFILAVGVWSYFAITVSGVKGKW